LEWVGEGKNRNGREIAGDFRMGGNISRGIDDRVKKKKKKTQSSISKKAASVGVCAKAHRVAAHTGPGTDRDGRGKGGGHRNIDKPEIHRRGQRPVVR